MFEIIFNSDNCHLTRFNIATISKTLVKNVKYTWFYMDKWLHKNPLIRINRKILPETFIKTENRYENYQFVVSRFFYKLSKESIDLVKNI